MYHTQLSRNLLDLDAEQHATTLLPGRSKTRARAPSWTFPLSKPRQELPYYAILGLNTLRITLFLELIR
jgi:hypothetical protein